MKAQHDTPAGSMRRRWLASACAWAALTALSPGMALAQAPQVETARRGELITVSASVDLPVDVQTAWSVISDYDHLADFIPDMQSSRVIEREGDRLLVEQKGMFGFLFFQQPVEARLAVTEMPQRSIVARSVAGNFKEMEGRYVLEPLPGGEVRLSYAGRLVPAFTVPPVVGTAVVRNMLTRQFSAMAAEILRRDRLGSPTRGP